jgi:hypothetical protein
MLQEIYSLISVEKDDYKKAIKEWYFTDEVIDNNEDGEIDEIRPSCELCEHEDLRWQFIIKNMNNNNYLKVGSTCIKQFDIVLIDKHGNKKYGDERDSNLERAINKKRAEAAFNNVLETLRTLWKKDKDTSWNKHIVICGKQWKCNGSLEPDKLAFIINRFNENSIKYKKLELKINLRKKIYKDQILEMERWKYLLIRPYIHSKPFIDHLDQYFENK